MKHKKLKISLISAAVAIFMLVASLTVYAYFTTRVYVYTEDGKEVAHVGMNLQLLFGKLDTTVATGTDLKIPSYTVVDANGADVTDDKGNWIAIAGDGQYLHYNDGVTYDPANNVDERTLYDPEAPWGSAQNPYVISESRHLQNLSALQSVGYFDMLYIGDNFTSGNYNEGSAAIPYFVICKTDGTPVNIDGSEINVPIKPIGSAEHPFIGVIGGAFKDGTATVEGKQTGASAIHNFQVKTNTNQIDVGLFGFIGFMGKEPTAEELAAAMENNASYVPQFEGVFSSIQNVLISDVSVTVSQPTLTESISELFMPFWDAFFGNSNGKVDDGEVLHRFTYTDKGATEIPHETHHIGIFAGHVSYALMNNISVYYSDDNTYAIDLTATDLDKDNYYSASGILGMMYNMNCAISNKVENNVVVGNCVVTMGTGTSNDEINTGNGGTGTGGGALSGNGRGYVTAAEIFTDFNNVAVQMDSNNELLWEYLLQGAAEANRVTGAILIYKNGASYTLADGKTAATINGASVTAGGNTWNKFFIRETYTNDKGEQRFRYFGPDGTTPLAEYELMGNKYNGQTIWKYSAGGNGIWHYGIRVIKSGDTYKLDNGTTGVKFDDTNCQITTEDGSTVWKNFFITEIIDGTNESYMFDPTTGKRVDITTFERKPMTLIEAYRINSETNAHEDLCVEWESSFLGFTRKMGLYYFYDGVFTFGLSSPEDTICDTWENDQVPNLYLGSTKSEDWEVLSTDNQAVVAFLKPVTSNKELADAIANNRQIYITSQPNTGNAGDVFLMSLINNNTATDGLPPITSGISSGLLNFDNTISSHIYKAYTEDGYTTLPSVPNITVTGGYSEMYPEFDDVDDKIAQLRSDYWGDGTKNKVLFIGRDSEGTSIDQIRENYNIIPDTTSEIYYFMDNTGTPVSPNKVDGTVPVYETWNGFFFYEYETYRDLLVTKSNVWLYYQAPDGTVYPIDKREGGIGSSVQDKLNTLINNHLDASDQTSSRGDTLYFSTGYAEDVALPLVNLTDSQFYNHGNDSGRPAYVNGSKVSQDTGTTKGYFIWNASDGKYYKTDERTETTANAETESGAVQVNKYPSYTFTDYSEDSFLQIINHYTRNSWLGNPTGSGFSIWAGTNSKYHSLSYSKDNAPNFTYRSLNGILVFEPNTEYCYIRYIMGNSTQYVNSSYDPQTVTAKFGSADTNAGNDTKLYIYVIEGVLDMDYGASKFVPKEGTTSIELSANSVVFWPQTSLKGQHVIPDANGVNQTYQAGIYSNLGPFDTTKVQTLVANTHTAASDVSPDPVYSIIPLTGTGGLNWGTKDGYKLGNYGLDKKFHLADQTGFGPIINLNDIFGFDLGEIPVGESNMMIAPVGSDGVEANVPKGCVAFRVNAGGKQSIRVIVAVPTTEKYLGEQGFELDMLKDYYIGVWQVEAAGDSIYQTFSKGDALEKFELPRSYMFNAESTPVAEDKLPEGATYKNYVDVDYNGTRYRTYLNGDCFLVGYEFTVYGEGVYVIGSVHGTDNAVTEKDVPMEIVHFSVSGTASAGRDGVTGNQLGAIDFVYDDTVNSVDTIITVDRTGLTGGTPNTGNTENYANYYASHCLLYSNNETKDANNNFIGVTKGMVWVRRYISVTNGAGTTILSYKVGELNSSNTLVQTEAFLGKQYAVNADELELRPIP